ncbi:DUF2645 family protein [Sphingomonas sp. DT-51]|uniref:DUF2645 family protein n=1 Tax=Sphingomonas sp. DT-51 TaxID=3396165 RepID=UPI003F1C9700
MPPSPDDPDGTTPSEEAPAHPGVAADEPEPRGRSARHLARAKRLALALLALATAMAIVVLSIQPYEWIMREQDGTPARTLCAVPVASDPASPLLGTLLLLPVVALVACAWCRPRSRLCLLMSGAVAGLWLYRFYLRFAGC